VKYGRVKPDELEKKRASGLPGGGGGRKDEVGRSGVYPMSGQGERGAAGYKVMASPN